MGANAVKKTFVLAVVIFFAATASVSALYSVANSGKWPETWPKELESLRATSKTYVGPMMEHEHYLIPFKTRDEFEAAWPHILKLKSKGAPLILLRGPKTDFMPIEPAGVLIHTPPRGTDTQKNPEEPLGGIGWETNVRGRWMWTTYIELVVDGEIVDLNRIPLPADTPIFDERFHKQAKPE
jgi:hypothetical protein